MHPDHRQPLPIPACPTRVEIRNTLADQYLLRMLGAGLPRDPPAEVVEYAFELADAYMRQGGLA